MKNRFKFLLIREEKNAIKPSLIKKLGLYILKIEVTTQKIDCSKLEKFEIVIISFLINNEAG